MATSLFYDFYMAPLNACSLESLDKPIETGNGSFWPVVASCYNLEDDGSRIGNLDLFLVKVPSSEDHGFKFGEPSFSKSYPSGILDGKWLPSSKSKENQFWLATAQSSGEIFLHVFHLEESGKTAFNPISTSSSKVNVEGKSALCLALNWDTSRDFHNSRVVSSYSNGKAAVHDVILRDSSNAPELIQKESWDAHTLFGAPAEVWSCAFASDGALIMTGADDATMKVWDPRILSRPVTTFNNHFEAGVTVISPNPRNSNLVAVGSYDEKVYIFDIRYSSQTLLSQSSELGGGVWRIQWHPVKDDTILLASMHAGARVVTLHSNPDPSSNLSVKREFLEHKSMTYGATWLVTNNGLYEAAATCSFYDRTCYIWRAD
jgi:diphthine methyl ester acylhydrolase